MRSFLFVVFAIASISASAADSLVPNGNFELDSKGIGWPDGWAKKDGMTWEKDGSKRFMRLESQSAGQQVMLYRAIMLKPGITALEFKIRFRTAGIKRGAEKWHDARVVLHIADPSGKPLKPDPKTIVLPADSKGWEERSVRFAVPEGAGKIEILPALFNVEAGKLDIGEISLIPVDAP